MRFILISREAMLQCKHSFAEIMSRVEEESRRAIAAVEVDEHQLLPEIENEQDFKAVLPNFATLQDKVPKDVRLTATQAKVSHLQTTSCLWEKKPTWLPTPHISEVWKGPICQ